MSLLSIDERSLNAGLVWILWTCHVSGLVIWCTSSVWAIWRQRKMGTAGSTASAEQMRFPTENEVLSLRLMAAYVFLDFFRAFDGCFDGSDGICRAVFGITPLALRFVFWTTRDIALLTWISETISFQAGWTCKALDLPAPLKTQRMLHGALWCTCLGLFGSFSAMCVTNRQSYQVMAMSFVISLNVVWSITAWDLLHNIVPKLEEKCRLGKFAQADMAIAPNTPPKRGDSNSSLSEDDNEKSYSANGASQDVVELDNNLCKTIKAKSDQDVPIWLRELVTDLRSNIKMLFAASWAILIIFPCLGLDRVIFKGAHTLPVIPSMPLGTWVGSRPSPVYSEQPAGVMLNPALEIVEMLIGWLQWNYIRKLATRASTLRPPHGPPGAKMPACGYITEDALAAAVRAALPGEDKKVQ